MTSISPLHEINEISKVKSIEKKQSITMKELPLDSKKIFLYLYFGQKILSKLLLSSLQNSK